MQYGGADVEIFVELVLQVESEQCLALGGEKALVLECHADVLARVDNALVGDCDYAHGVVNGVVGVFRKPYASGHYHHGAAWNIHGVEPYLRACRSLVFAREHEFVLVGVLACHHEG